jgi:hypothetical protein
MLTWPTQTRKEFRNCARQLQIGLRRLGFEHSEVDVGTLAKMRVERIRMKGSSTCQGVV